MKLLSVDELLKHTNCATCPLSRGGFADKTRLLPGRGTERAQIAIVGESPTSSDLYKKQVFSGASGSLAAQIVEAVGLQYHDIYWANSLLCNYPHGSKPDPMHCNRRLVKELNQLPKLKVVIAMGTLANQALTGRGAVSKDIYRVFWHAGIKAFVVPTYHTAFAYKEVEAFNDIVWALERAISLLDKTQSHLDPPECTLRIATSQEECVTLLKEVADISEPTSISVDWETDGLAKEDTTLAVGFCYRPNEALIIPWVTDIPDKPSKHDIMPNMAMFMELQRIAANPNLKFVFHNGDFDVRLMIRKCGVHFRVDCDTMILDYALDERGGQSELEGAQKGIQIGSHRLKSSAQRYLHIPDWERGLKQYIKTSKTKYSHIPRTLLYEYLGYDVIHTLALKDKLDQELDLEPPSHKGWWTPKDCVYRLMMPALNEIIIAEAGGISIDRQKAVEVGNDMDRQLLELHVQIQNVALELGWSNKKKFNQRSSAHMKTLIYELLKIPLTPDLKRTLDGKPIKTKWPTGKDVLARIRHHSPIFDLILRYRALHKRKGTYVQRVIDQAEETGFIHGDIRLTVTRTGRLSARNPNLQNIDPSSKIFYEPDVDHVFVNADYRQLEVRVAAWFSRDKNLIAACTGDIHGEIAKEVFAHIFKQVKSASTVAEYERICYSHMVLDPVARKHMSEPFTDASKFEAALKKRLRDAAKPIIFGVLYGREAFSLANGPLQCSEREAQTYIDNLFEKFDTLAGWLESQKCHVLDHSWIETPTGRRRRFPFIHPDFESRILKQTINAPVQGFASDICLTAFVNVSPKLRDMGYGRSLFLVHDSIAYSIAKENKTEALTLIKQEMEGSYTDPEIKFAVEVMYGPNYGECKTEFKEAP